MAVAGLIMGAVSTGLSAYGQAQQGKSAQALANYNAEVGKITAAYNADAVLKASELNVAQLEQTSAYNAGLARMEADLTVQEGLAQALGVRQQGRNLQGTQRARRAASGVVVGTGSSLVVDVAQAGIIEQRALEVERQANNRANALNTAAATELVQARNAVAQERWRAKTEATLIRQAGGQRAALDLMQGSAARTGGNLGAAATILQGASRAYAGYYG